MKVNNRRTYRDWTDIAFTALPPGWVNVFEKDDGTHYTEPCPGVLVQESVTAEKIWDEEDDDGHATLRTQSYETEREVRTVFVCAGYNGESYLRPVDDEPGYIVTTTPEQWDAWQLESMAADA
jgi:hypothetical protein